MNPGKGNILLLTSLMFLFVTIIPITSCNNGNISYWSTKLYLSKKEKKYLQNIYSISEKKNVNFTRFNKNLELLSSSIYERHNDTAIRLLLEFIEKAPFAQEKKNLPLRYWKAKILYKLGDFNASNATLAGCKSLDDEDPASGRLSKNIYGLQNELDAVRQLRQLRQRSDGCLDRLIAFASRQMARGEYRDLLHVLDHIHPDKVGSAMGPEERTISMYYRGECNYRLNNPEEARAHFLGLEMNLLRTGSGIRGSDHPLLAKIRNRLSALELPAAKAPRSMLPERLNWVHMGSSLGGLLGLALFTWVFWRWHSVSIAQGRSFAFPFSGPASRASQGGTPYRIKDKVITLEEMRVQDGRVSSLALEDVRKRKLAGRRVASDDESRHALLILEGRDMIERLNTLLPYPLLLVERLSAFGCRHRAWRIIVFSCAFTAAWGIVKFGASLVTGSVMIFDVYTVIGLLLTTILLVAILSGMNIMARKTVDSLDELVTMLEGTSSLAKIESWIRGLFRSTWQLYIGLILFGISLIDDFQADQLLVVDPLIFSLDALFTLVLIVLTAPLIWFLLRTFSLTNSICRLKDLELGANPLSPLKTLGLQKWINVIGTYAVVGSLVLTFGSSMPVIIAHMEGVQLEPKDFRWLMIFLPLLVCYWIFPYFRLSEAVKNIKMQRMQFLKTLIARTFQDWKENEEAISQERYVQHRLRDRDLNEAREDGLLDMPYAGTPRKEFLERLAPMDKYYDLFQKLDRSPESFVDFSAFVELAKIIGLPSIIVALVTYFFI